MARRARAGVVWVAAFSACCGQAPAAETPQQIYDELNRFCIAEFGAEYAHNEIYADNVFITKGRDRGTGYGRARFIGTGERGFSVGWTLTVQTAPGAAVTITDRAGKQVFAGEADAQGVVRAELLQFTQWPDKKAIHTPHTVTAAKDGETAKRQVEMNSLTSIELPLAPAAP